MNIGGVRHRTLGLRTLIGVCVIAGMGCAHRQKGFRCELPPQLFLTVSASANLNPNEAGEPLPTVVRIFQLASMTKADTFDSKDFWEHPAETLGTDLVAQEEFTLDPGEQSMRWVNRRGPTNYLVAVALFRQTKGKSWRTVVPLTPVDEDDCPADAPPPRTDNPRTDDVKILISLQRFEIEGTRIGARR